MKVGVFGAGKMGKSVIRDILDCPQLASILAYDLDPDRLLECKRRHGVDGTTDLARVLRDPELALVFVTASNDAHKELAIAALKAGKAVMCEKPMAMTLRDCREMLDCAHGESAFLQIGFELRYSRLYTQVKEWIDQQLIGSVINTHCEYICSEFWGKGTWRSLGIGGNMFGEKLSHYVDLPRWWIGNTVRSVYSVCAPNVVPYYRVRDNYHTTYKFENGAVSHLTFLMAPAATIQGDPLQNPIDQQRGKGHELRFFIQGTKGAIATDTYARTCRRWKFSLRNEQFISKLEETKTWSGDEDQSYCHNTREQARDIVKRVAEGNPPATCASDAYETMRLCFGAEESADTGRVVHLND